MGIPVIDQEGLEKDMVDLYSVTLWMPIRVFSIQSMCKKKKKKKNRIGEKDLFLDSLISLCSVTWNPKELA